MSVQPPPIDETRVNISPGQPLKADIAVIGAGVAGCAAAIRLARAGRSVVLLEKRRHPRDKACGGCLSGRAVKFLAELLPLDVPLPGVAGTNVLFKFGRYAIRAPADGLSRVVCRRELDQLLAHRAVESGAKLIEDQAAVPVWKNARWSVDAGDLCVESENVLIAAGAGSFARTLGIAGRTQPRRMAAQSWMQPPERGLPALGEVEMHWLRGGYVGLATCSSRECIVGYAAEVGGHDHRTVWERLRRLNPHSPLWNFLPEDAPRRFGAQGAAGFPWAPRRLGTGNCLLIGDAAGYVEPFTGEGMGQALCSARCAADAILAGGNVLAEYEQRMRIKYHSAARRLSWIGTLLRNPALHWVANLPPVLPQRWFAPLIARIHVGRGEFA